MSEEPLEPLSDGESMAFANLLLAMREPMTFTATYKNWRGEVSKRTIQPKRIWHGTTKWHPEPTLFLEAHDLGKREYRDFRLADFDMSSFALHPLDPQ